MGTEDIRCRIMEEELGTFWPQWHVVKRLGGGSFGDVFEIFRDNYGIRTFSALKVLRISDAEASYSLSSGNARPYNAEESCSNFGENNIPEVFMNEIRIMEALRGAPNIVSIENFHFRKNAETNSLYVRLELLTSFVKVMSDRQRSGRQFTIPEVLKIGKDICTALSFCEQRNIIHRDIKPANMFVDKFGNYKVGDFGASKRMETIHPTHMMTGIGTISYMAPEIFAGRSYNNTVDIYALGLVLYQLLNNGRMPFLPAYGQYTVQDIDAANYRRLHREELPPLAGIRIYGEMIDERLDSVIRKACDPDSHRRYRTAKEFYDALSGHEVREDNTQTISTTVRTAESSHWEPNPYQRSKQLDAASAAGYADHEKVYAQKEAGIQEAREEEGINLALIVAIVFIIALAILVTTGVISSPASEEANRSIQTESEDSTVIDEDEELVLKSPVQVISLGAFHSAAIDTDGNLWMWGHNEFDGQLGNGSTEDHYEPVCIAE